MAAPRLLLLQPVFSVRFRCLNLSGLSARWLVSSGCRNCSAENFTVGSASVIRSHRRKFSDRRSGSDNSSSDDEPSSGAVRLNARPRNRNEERKKFNQQNSPPAKTEFTFSEKVTKAAEEVGKLTTEPERITADLLSRLQKPTSQENSSNDGSQEAHSRQSFSLGELLSSMKTEEVSSSPSAKPHQAVEDDRFFAFAEDKKSSIFTGSRLDIFDPEIMNMPQKSSLTPLFDKVREEEVQMFANFPANNAFEEMVKWTKEGRMWHFPIDNEQGLDEEFQVPFTEHVFLDHLLEGFPKKGPIRHFMELVVVALSKNPYLTVKEKHDQIEWFREYFKDKLHLVEIVDTPEKLASHSE